MAVPFSKYQGTGNDFIIIDQFQNRHIKPDQQRLIRRLCDRRFGIGADGLILLQSASGVDFEMIYFNADGLVGSLCGNGSRCAVSHCHKLGRFSDHGRFIASDGVHEARISGANGDVEVRMTNVQNINTGKGFYFLNTGSPHYVTFVEDLSDLDVEQTGRAIRYSAPFREQGVNVNFVERIPDGIEVSTYERGVEAETLSCGTGVVASAISLAIQQKQTGSISTVIKTKGGKLLVRFEREGDTYRNIWLCGPAELIFEGSIAL